MVAHVKLPPHAEQRMYDKLELDFTLSCPGENVYLRAGSDNRMKLKDTFMVFACSLKQAAGCPWSMAFHLAEMKVWPCRHTGCRLPDLGSCGAAVCVLRGC